MVQDRAIVTTVD